MIESRSGGQILVDELRGQGTDTVFCVPGESFLAALDALHDTPEIRLVVARMEAGAANMACAHGQLTGRPGVCFVTRGPGATHAAVGVHTARQGSLPLVLLVGQVPLAHRGREAFQEVDLDAMFAPLAKWTATAPAPEAIPDLVQHAFAVAAGGRPGPVVLALPEDVLSARAALAGGGARATPATLPPADGDVQRTLDVVAGARRPIMLVGGGGWSQQAADDVAALAESWRLPIVSAYRCQDYVDNRSPSYVGTLGFGPDPHLVARVREADVVLVLGARPDEPTTAGYTTIAAPKPRQTLIHVHAHADELGRVFEPALAVHATAPAFLNLARAAPPPAGPPWAAWTRAARGEREAFARPPAGEPAPRLGGALARLCAELPDETILANGAGNYTQWAHRYWQFRRYGTQLAPVSGAMGYGVPAAIAAKLAEPERPVLSFNGDGCFLMCGQELATAVRHQTAVVFIVSDNGRYGTIRMHQERHYPGRPVGTDLVNPDFAAYARAFGLDGVSVTDGEELVTAVHRALAGGRPALIHIPMPPELLTPASGT